MLNNQQDALEIYKERWQIEIAFRALNSSGFNIDGTHLTGIERIEKLLVTVALAPVCVVSDYLHQYIKLIQIKKHENKAKTIFKHGLTYIESAFSNYSFQFDRYIQIFVMYLD